MLFKLSLKNMKKSFKDYAIYFITLVLGVAVFYMFNSLDSQEAMLKVSSSTKEIIKLMINAFVGGVVLFLINLVGAGFGFALNITWLTSLIVGIFGVPGVVLVILLQIVM